MPVGASTDGGHPEERIVRLEAEIANLEARSAHLAVVNHFAQTLLGTQSEVDEILWHVCNEAVARLGLEDCVIYLVDSQRKVLVQRAAYGPKNPRAREILHPISIPVGRGIVGTVAATGLAEVVADTRKDPRYIPDDQIRLSELAVPIRVDDRVVGVLDSEHSRLAFFTPYHLELLTAIAAMAASRLATAFLTEELQEFNKALEVKVLERTRELERAHQRSEELLLNVLPASIADRLKGGESRIAERFQDVSVLFADVVGFTHLSAHTPPEAMVAWLERIFVAFDDLSAEASCETIKTIGDAYMVVSGVPDPVDDHAAILAGLGLRFIDATRELAHQMGTPLQIRIGLHSGPVVAGILGRRRFAYDLWGDTVNVASRLESHGEPGRIHVHRSLVERLAGRFRFDHERVVELKGLGPQPTAFLVG
jgi:class 3 adenylate cyclase/putative methionine-R-sulfoxide reductase with GAF domain